VKATTTEEIVKAIKECAAELGRAPSYPELHKRLQRVLMMPKGLQLARKQRLSNYPRMCRAYLKIQCLFLFLLPVAGWGQTPLKVDLCDLVKEPQKYSRQWVEVRGAVDLAFENFTLRTTGCGNDRLRRVWLAYGGDEPTPITSLVNDRTRPPGMVLKVGGIPVPLLHDANLEVFKGRLVAQRITAPDGSLCYGDCQLYDVTASLVGLFMAAPKGANGAFSGYGHMGCCHLLTIQRITEVDAKRTDVPAGGKFRCSRETWEMDQAQARVAFAHCKCTDLADCRIAIGEQFGMVAEHWADKVDLNKGSAENFLSGAPLWRSADMQTTYLLGAHYRDERHGTGLLLGATATRTACQAIEAPYPQTTPIRCKELFSDFDVPRKEKLDTVISAPSPRWNGDKETVSRLALQEAAKRWGVDLLPGLSLQECSKPKAYQDQYTWCRWSEPTSMQGFSIQISRSHFQHTWKLTRGDGMACVAEGQ